MKKMHAFYIREFQGTSYGEKVHPFESDQEFNWFDPENPNIGDIREMLAYLGYNARGARITPTGIPGIGITSKHLDVVLGFAE